jgi:hypothetical protein
MHFYHQSLSHTVKQFAKVFSPRHAVLLMVTGNLLGCFAMHRRTPSQQQAKALWLNGSAPGPQSARQKSQARGRQAEALLELANLASGTTLLGGFKIGDVVYSQINCESEEHGEAARLRKGDRGEVKELRIDDKLKVDFDRSNDGQAPRPRDWIVFPNHISILPGGYTIGDTVEIAGGVHVGVRGTVMGPSSNGKPAEVKVDFNGALVGLWDVWVGFLKASEVTRTDASSFTVSEPSGPSGAPPQSAPAQEADGPGHRSGIFRRTGLPPLESAPFARLQTQLGGVRTFDNVSITYFLDNDGVSEHIGNIDVLRLEMLTLAYAEHALYNTVRTYVLSKMAALNPAETEFANYGCLDRNFKFLYKGGDGLWHSIGKRDSVGSLSENVQGGLKLMLVATADDSSSSSSESEQGGDTPDGFL